MYPEHFGSNRFRTVSDRFRTVLVEFDVFSDSFRTNRFYNFKFQLARAGALPWPTAVPIRRGRPPFRPVGADRRSEAVPQPWPIEI